ncbi:MAG: invasion associated locus B family protein [Sphingomonadales bacterium]
MAAVFVIAGAGFSGLGLNTAIAQSPGQSAGREFLGGYRDWDAFKERRADGETICYMISVPKDTAPANVRRGEIYAIITHWPKAEIRSQVNVVVGYPFRENSTASAAVDGRAFQMFTQGERAWAYDDKQDRDMTNAMKRGARFVVKGTSSRGTNTTDNYSLSGFTAAHNAITQACF